MKRALKTPRLAARLGLDAAMVLLFVTSLAFRVTGRQAHEWIGVAFCLLLAVHTFWNRGWYGNLFTGKYSARRAANTITSLALVAAMAALCVCGVLNSRHIFGFSQFIDGESVRRIHTFAAYWSLVLVGVHAGLHWEMITSAAARAFGRDGTRKTVPLPGWALASAVAGLGVWASFERDMGAKLFQGFSFDFWNPDSPFILFFACNLAIMGVYALAAHSCVRALKSAHGKQPRLASKGCADRQLQSGKKHDHQFFPPKEELI